MSRKGTEELTHSPIRVQRVPHPTIQELQQNHGRIPAISASGSAGIASRIEHNSVLRPLAGLEDAGRIAVTSVWNAAKIHKVAPLRLSVKGTLQHMATFSPLIIYAPARRRKQLYLQFLKTIASEVLPDRPNRIEPRLVKRRPKSYRWLTRPRAEWHRRLRV